ncbi:hypothetical protein [Georgenia sp. AZ-5]|uniref:hypothetical protein n=1 Tax=Georgenia sp. AZ-5 TaxID=3367526 RepID=UPI003754BF76
MGHRGWAALGWLMLVGGAGFVIAGLGIGVWRATDGVTMQLLYAVARLLAGGSLLMYGGRRLLRRHRPRSAPRRTRGRTLS